MLLRISKRVESDSFPKLSVVIPSYNKVDYIGATLESIFSQNYPNLEVIVQDGGSTDGTLDVIKKCAKDFPRDLRWVSKKDKGPVDAVNKGLAKAEGDIVTFINADDVYIQDAFNKVAACYLRNKDDLWWVGKGIVLNKKGKEITPWVSTYKNFLLKLNKYPILLIVNYITQPSVFIRRDEYERLGKFTGSERYVMEYDSWIKIAANKMPCVIDENLSAFRLLSDNLSAKHFKNILDGDYKIAASHTGNPLILLLHYLHNLGRILALHLLSL